MPDKSRVPRPLNDFDKYINATDNFLQATDLATSQPNWQKLELKAAEANWWHERRQHWRDKLNPLRAKDKRTVPTTKSVANFIADFKAHSVRILDKIAAADAAGTVEEAVFRLVLKKHRKKPVRHETAISDRVALIVHLKGGGRLHFVCRTGHDINRASLAKHANCVQLAYSFDSKDNYDTVAHKIISTHAAFTHDFGTANIGKWVYIYVRWYNTKHPRLAGAWSEMTKVMIG